MCIAFRIVLLGAMLLVPIVAGAESTEDIEDKIEKTLDSTDPTTTFFSETIHFDGPDDTSVIVEPGFYKVSRVENLLQLAKIGGERTYTLKAKLDHHEESLQEPVAVKVYGDVADEPDISVLMLQLPDGTQLAADGSYSGIRPRGLRDRLRAARAKMQRRAQQIRLKAQQRRKKMAAAARTAGFFNQLRKQAKAMPKLSQAEKAQLKKRTQQYVQKNKEILQEFVKRIKNNKALFTRLRRKGITNLNHADLLRVREAIIGSGDKMLRLNHSKAKGQPIPRSIISKNKNEASFTVGYSMEASAVVGVGAGYFAAIGNNKPSSGPPIFYGQAFWAPPGFRFGNSGNIDIGIWGADKKHLAGCDQVIGFSYHTIAGAGLIVVYTKNYWDSKTNSPGTYEDWEDVGAVIAHGAGLDFNIDGFPKCVGKLLG